MNIKYIYIFFSFLIRERYKTSWIITMSKIISLWNLTKNDICRLLIHEFKFYALSENLNMQNNLSNVANFFKFHIHMKILIFP